MKRLICFLAAIALAVSLCACGASSPAGPTDAKEPIAEVEAPTQNNEPAEEPAQAEEPAAEPAQSEEPVEEPKQNEEPVDEPEQIDEPAEEPVESETQSDDVPTEEPVEDQTDEAILWNSADLFTFGTIEGDAYENEVLGYGFRMDGWSFADEARVAEMNNWSLEEMSSDLQSLIRDTSTFFEMYAESEDGYQNVNIQFQPLTTAAMKLMSVDTIIDVSIPTVLSSIEEVGYEDPQVEKATVMMGPDEQAGVSITGTYLSVPIYQKEAIFRCGTQYMAFVTVTSLFEDNVDDIFAAFYRLNNE